MALLPYTCKGIYNLPTGGGAGLQDAKGSPVYPGGQLQIGLCEVTRQMASAPQDPGQGSLHFCCIQALSAGQSLLITHSVEKKSLGE